VKPRFTGGLFKKLLDSQNEDNKDKNANIGAIQEKLKQDIVIHNPKPIRVEG